MKGFANASIGKEKKKNYSDYSEKEMDDYGLEDQMLINVGKRIPEMKLDVPDNFGFVVKKGSASYVKFIEFFKD